MWRRRQPVLELTLTIGSDTFHAKTDRPFDELKESLANWFASREVVQQAKVDEIARQLGADVEKEAADAAANTPTP